MSACVADAALALAKWPILDTLLAAFWFGSVWGAWRSYQAPTQKDDVDERNLGATVILGQLNGGITSASIIVAGVGTFVALTPENHDTFTLALLKLAAIFAVLALGSAVYAMGTLPTRAPTTNFVRSKAVAILSTIPLIFVTLAAIRFALAIWLYLS